MDTVETVSNKWTVRAGIHGDDLRQVTVSNRMICHGNQVDTMDTIVGT